MPAGSIRQIAPPPVLATTLARFRRLRSARPLVRTALAGGMFRPGNASTRCTPCPAVAIVIPIGIGIGIDLCVCIGIGVGIGIGTR